MKSIWYKSWNRLILEALGLWPVRWWIYLLPGVVVAIATLVIALATGTYKFLIISTIGLFATSLQAYGLWKGEQRVNRRKLQRRKR